MTQAQERAPGAAWRGAHQEPARPPASPLSSNAVPVVGTVALFPWGDVIEDYLDSIGLTFADFCERVHGTWMFGYVEALQRVGWRVVLICISSRAGRPQRFQHLPTGATVWQVPASSAYRLLRPGLSAPRGAGPGAPDACCPAGHSRPLRREAR